MGKQGYMLLVGIMILILAVPLGCNIVLAEGDPSPEAVVNRWDWIQSEKLLSGMRLENKAEGYTLVYPQGFQIEAGLGPLVTILHNSSTQIEIYHEKYPRISAEEYINYSLAPILDGRDPVRIAKHTVSTLKGFRVYQLWWSRNALNHVPRDKNYYAVVHFKTGPREVFTIHFKTSDPQWLSQNVPEIIRSFRLSPVKGTARYDLTHTQDRKYPLTPRMEEFLREEFASGRQQWGIFEPGAPEDFGGLQKLEDQADYRFKYLLVYSNINSTLPGQRLNLAAREERVLEYTLQTLIPGRDHKESIIYDLLNGEYNQYLRSYARSMGEYGGPVLFRLNNEMNGDWCGYSAYYSSLDPELYKALWRYIYEIFQEEGAHNVLWVWNPNEKSFPGFKWNHALMYYPGDEYVDIIGLTGYNTGNYYRGETWRSFPEIYSDLYSQFCLLFPDKPLIITEFGSSSRGGDKADWIKEAMASLPDYSRISLAVWWNHIDWDGPHKARIYRLEEEDSLEALQIGLQNPGFRQAVLFGNPVEKAN